jgi:molybdenum cofactor synthesis domain-containing protein
MASSRVRETGGPSGGAPDAPVRAVLVATGTEIALGRTVDTNCAFLAGLLAGWGVAAARHLTVADDPDDLERAISECWAGYDLTVMTGGLGPTEDDWTRLAAARAFRSPLAFSHETAAAIRDRMGAWGFACPPNNMRQAWAPACARVIPNARGTAPAFAVVDARAGRAAVFLPGVPREAEFLAETELKPILDEIVRGETGAIATWTLKAAGLGEGRVDELLKDLMRGSVNPYVGLSAGLYETRILVTASAGTREEAEALAAPLMEEIESRLGKHLAGTGEGGIRQAAAEILREKRLRLGLIDSITGGVLARSLLELLPPECLAGAVSCAPGLIHGLNAQNYLSVEGADLVMSLSSKSSPSLSGPDAQEAGLAGKITVVTHIRDSRPKVTAPSWARRDRQKANDFFQITPISGPHALLNDRVAALACFQLWGFLRDKG